MKNLHILKTVLSDYDSNEVTIVGVTDDPAVSHAFLQLGVFSELEHEVDVVTLNVLEGALRQRLDDWLDSRKNPMCECGHRLLHHRRKNNSGTCRHNHSYPTTERPNGHKCKGFRLAEEPQVAV